MGIMEYVRVSQFRISGIQPFLGNHPPACFFAENCELFLQGSLYSDKRLGAWEGNPVIFGKHRYSLDSSPGPSGVAPNGTIQVDRDGFAWDQCQVSCDSVAPPRAPPPAASLPIPNCPKIPCGAETVSAHGFIQGDVGLDPD